MAHLPEVTVVRELAGSLRFELLISSDLDCLRGHFPGVPILPGVVQVQWATRFGREHWPAFGEFIGMDKLKFQNPIVPATRVCMELTPECSHGVLSFRFFDAGTTYSSGRIRFART